MYIAADAIGDDTRYSGTVACGSGVALYCDTGSIPRLLSTGDSSKLRKEFRRYGFVFITPSKIQANIISGTDPRFDQDTIDRILSEVKRSRRESYRIDGHALIFEVTDEAIGDDEPKEEQVVLHIKKKRGGS